MKLRLLTSRTLVVGAVAFAIVGSNDWHGQQAVSLAMDSVSLACLLVAGIGRIWCSAHIAGRKNAEVVTEGPYSVCRNPLYFFSLLAFIGAGLAFESLTICAIFTGVFLLTHWPTIHREEAFLRATFGAPYDAYCARVPRLFPKLSLYSGSSTMTINAAAFNRELREAGMIPLAFIGAHAVVLCHDAGIIPRFFSVW